MVFLCLQAGDTRSWSALAGRLTQAAPAHARAPPPLLRAPPACCARLRAAPRSQTAGGIFLPETGKKLNEGVVVAVGPGAVSRDGAKLPMHVSVGETVLLPEYGGHTVSARQAGGGARSCRRLRSRALRSSSPLPSFFRALPPQVKIGEDELHLYREEDILGKFAPLK